MKILVRTAVTLVLIALAWFAFTEFVAGLL